ASAEKNLGHIVSIAIQPSERKRDIGRNLMVKMLKILETSGVTTVRLEVRKSNLEAQRFYELLGFKCSHTVDNYYGDENAIIYFKSI
ncbi:GNAT family N-acetyltransferase, partial [Candidatus Bathyarchaeota archaeon]|nr:GNAT family N-acetyltransferase [Candidatus Bathyarchaeota archaeon]